ncbi:MAG: hypothetical protein ACP6IY_22270 [Promethearchaeia archaeon]
MNKKTQLQKKATLLLKQYQELLSKQRNYNNTNWHCINVKRYNDYVDIDILIKDDFKKYSKKYKEQLLNEFNEDNIYGKFGIYYNWLEMLWDQINYEISNIETITKGCKNKHKKFQYIALQGEIKTENYKTQCNKCYKKTWYNNGHRCMMNGCDGILQTITYKQEYDNRKMIYSLGQNGGWACFQDNINDNVENFLNAIIDWNIEEMRYNDMDVERKEKPLDDVVVKLNNIEAMMEEIEYIKNYIDNFNKSYEFKNEIKSRIEEKIIEFEEENKELVEDETRFKTDIMAYSNTIQNRLNIYKKNKELVKLIARHLNGIKCALKD